MSVVKMRQIATGHFRSESGYRSYSVLGVGEDGVVYRYDPKCNGWIPWSMEIVTCGETHKAKR